MIPKQRFQRAQTNSIVTYENSRLFLFVNRLGLSRIGAGIQSIVIPHLRHSLALEEQLLEGVVIIHIILFVNRPSAGPEVRQIPGSFSVASRPHS